MSPDPAEEREASDPQQTSFSPLLEIKRKPVSDLPDEALVESEYVDRSLEDLEAARNRYLTAAAADDIDSRERDRARSHVQELTRAIDEVGERMIRSQRRGDPPGCWCLGLGGGRGQRGIALGSPQDMSEMHPVSRVDSFIPLGSKLAPLFPKLYCPCPIGQDRKSRERQLVEAWQQGWRARQEAADLKARWDESGLPPVQKVRPLTEYPQRTTEQRATIEAVKAWKITRWLCLQGKPQRGKTTIAEALARRALESGRTVRFMEIAALMDHLRTAYARRNSSGLSEEELLRPFKDCDFLFLDDIGARKASTFVLQQLFQILEYRKQRGLPIVFTTNRPLIAVEPHRVGELTPGEPDMRDVEGEYTLAAALLGRNMGPTLNDINDPDDPDFAEAAEYVHRIEARMRLMCTVINVEGPPLTQPWSSEDQPALEW
jgi:IstB-like ATP binding protein